MNGYSRKTFVEADDHTRHGMTYDILEDIFTRIQALENKRWLHASLQAIGGIIGGAGAVFVYVKFLC